MSLTLAQAHARWKEAKQALPECIDDCFGNQSGEHDSLCPRAGLNVALLSLRLHEAEAALLSLPSAPQEPPCEKCAGKGTTDGVLTCGYCNGTGVASAQQEPPQEQNIFEKKWRPYLLDRITKVATADSHARR